jgi:uncharacterized membrane protein
MTETDAGKPRRSAQPTWASPRLPPILLGIGLGGFVDGIVLHQMLQWHHMLTGTDRYPATTVAGLEVNTLADGLFHGATWVFVVVGSVLMYRAWTAGLLAPPARVHYGLVLAGWGLFDVAEGVVDHHLLGVHHVRDDLGGPLGWDLGFLTVGALMLVGGMALTRHGRRTA